MKKNRRKLHAQIVFVGLVFSVFNFGAYADEQSFNIYIQNARTACSGISDSLADMKSKAGINTALTGVGTATGAVALGTGIVKANVDQEIEKWEAALQEMVQKQKNEGAGLSHVAVENLGNSYDEKIKSINALQSGISEATKTSKTLGNVRTGGLAVSATTDTAGAVMSALNRVDKDLHQRVAECGAAVAQLEQEQSRARAENTATEQELRTADKIITGCSDWNKVDLSKIDKRAMGATISGGTGAALALAGTATSAAANLSAVRNDNSDSGKQKEKNLNTASNVLAGGTAAASLVATVFNATQISAIKKAVAAADKCEEALR